MSPLCYQEDIQLLSLAPWLCLVSMFLQKKQYPQVALWKMIIGTFLVPDFHCCWRDLASAGQRPEDGSEIKQRAKPLLFW